MRFLDLFAGIGGFRLALEQAGHKCIGFCEIDRFARQTYKANFDTEGEVEWHDITTVTDEDVRQLGSVDIITGGFPCQAFSIAGKRGGFNDTRGTLFFEIARIARILKPRYLLLENVKGLLNHSGGTTFATILNTLGELGYWVEWQILNSKDFGVPQNRERVFIVGHFGGEPRRKVFPITRSSGQALTELTQGLADAYRVYDPAGVARTLKAEAGGVGAKTGLYAVRSLGNIYPSGGQNGEVYDPKGLSPTLRSGQGVKGRGIGSNNSPKIAVPVLTPDRAEKRQNGRRFKEPGEPMFTLTAQDRHGVLVGKGEQYGETEEGNAVKRLRELREEIGEKAFAEWGLGILNSLQSEEVLQQGVHGERIQRREEERKFELDRGSQESTGVSEKDGMLKMRKQREFRYSPQGRRLPEQLHQELSCIMQELSYEGTSRERFLQSLWAASEGIGVLREALSTVQEAWAPSGNKEAKRAYRIRRLTPLETFRLQGFPDEFFHRAKAAGVSDSQLYKQAGNAVTVNVVYEIARRLQND